MKMSQILGVLFAFLLASGTLLAAETPNKKAPPGNVAGCCVRAVSDAKTCAHPCCVEAAKLTKNCERCGGTNTAAAPAPKKDAPPAKKY